MTKILIPIPSYGFDPTEAAVPWKLLTDSGFEVAFATPDGTAGSADLRMLTGEGLGFLRRVLQAREDAVEAYREMEVDPAFLHPMKYVDVVEGDFEGLLLPGGHDKRVREYLESEVLQRLVVELFRAEKPVGAICHAVILPARSIDPATGRSVLYGYKTTSWLQTNELLSYQATRLWLGDYLVTYPGTTVEEEVRAALADEADFVPGPNPVLRDDPEHLDRGFALRDRHYVSARWYGDVYNFAKGFFELLQEAA